ncbi:MAG: PilW family protein [Alphaproteobacteria bacterium]|nr:PilW family protein [Alphaproteobacteria bacterium]
MTSRRIRGGFSLLEMMTAIFISLVVVAALYALLMGQSRQLIYQDIRMEMNQNLRFGTDILTRTIRMGGYGTGGEVVGVFGHTGVLANANSSQPAFVSYDAWNGSHDAISVTYADPSLEMMSSLATLNCGTNGVTFPMGRNGYRNYITNYSVGDLLLCWDYTPITGTVSYMWTIDGAGNSTTGGVGVVQNTGLYTDYDAVCPSTGNLPPVMHCSLGQVVTFYIDDTDDGVGPGSPEHPVLMMDLDFDFPGSGPTSDDIPLVDDIEDLQVSYCAPTTANTAPDCSDNTNWSDTLNTTDEQADVWMVRVSLVARSSRPDRREVNTSTPMSLENHNPTPNPDNYWRQALSTAVTVRNNRLRYGEL